MGSRDAPDIGRGGLFFLSGALSRGATRRTGRADVVCGRVRPDLGVEGFDYGGHLEESACLVDCCDEIG